MRNELATLDNTTEDVALAVQSVLVGDVSKLKPQEKVQYLMKLSESLGLNPLSKPFQFISVPAGRGGWKEIVYATKDCTEQLRARDGVSIVELSNSTTNDVYVVTAKAQNAKGRIDCATGAVPIQGLRGNDLANALMKAETKAKRRVTLSICGLGFLDESETETIVDAKAVRLPFDPQESAGAEPVVEPPPSCSTGDHDIPGRASQEEPSNTAVAARIQRVRRAVEARQQAAQNEKDLPSMPTWAHNKCDQMLSIFSKKNPAKFKAWNVDNVWYWFVERCIAGQILPDNDALEKVWIEIVQAADERKAEA